MKPKTDHVVYPDIKICIPYTKIQDATLIALIGYDFTATEIGGDFGYSNYFKDRWDEGETFINLEHDVVVYPGAIKALWDCPEPWCAYDYHLPVHWPRSLTDGGVPLGCVKISKEMIDALPGYWDTPVMWDVCDQHLAKAEFKIHQHYPSVVNANPTLLGMI